MISRSSLVLFVCLLQLARPLSHHRLKVRRQLVSEEGLYGNETKVIRLNVNNFDNIYGTDNAWLVEFYANWCSHCQRFAPIYTALAADTAGWSNVVKVAAVDCAASINSALCRTLGITHYPTLRFFHDNSDNGYEGLSLEKKNSAEAIRDDLVQQLIKEQQEGRGKTWPTITPSRNDDLWSNVPSSTKYAVVIHEGQNSSIGAEMVLDFDKTRSVAVKRILSEEAESSPSVTIIERGGDEEPLVTDDSSREAFFRAAKTFLNSKGIYVSTGENEEQDVGLETASRMPEENGADVQYRSDVLYQVDLENAVRYSFKREVAIRNVIEGDSLSSLKNYLKVLAKYFPIGRNGQRFFRQLRNWAVGKDSITGKDFVDRVESLEEEMKPVFNSKEEWLGCRGSSIKYRGYPCGMWTLFHTLTTNAVLQKGASTGFDNLEVLEAMAGYIRNFFGCQECARHFQGMAETSMHGNVTNPDDGIAWLWRAHNTVNKRLAGDVTEDPKHPKIQFPSPMSCPKCRDARGEWIDHEAIAFLKHMYGKENINYSRWTKPLNEDEGEDGEADDDGDVLPHPEGQIPEGPTSRSSGWSALGVPLLLTAVTAIGLLAFYMSSRL